MSEELTLLPCPACGGKADIIDSFERNDKGHVAIGWSAYCTRGCLTTSEHGSRERPPPRADVDARSTIGSMELVEG